MNEAAKNLAPAGEKKIPLIDLQAQRASLGGRIEAAMMRAVERGQYIMGPEVAELEKALADYAGVAHCIGCGNGTDALRLILMALDVGPGDAVVVPAFTFAATPEAVALCQAVPVFADVREDTFNIDPASFEAAIKIAKAKRLTPRGVIPVDLFGQPAEYDRIEEIAARHGMWVLPDAAQSFGSRFGARRAGQIGVATATSFFPSKPLGCYGDGGAIFTDDAGLAQHIRSLRVHGKGVDKYENDRVGLNSRLDTIQAAVLIEKLSVFDREIAARRRLAARYDEILGNLVGLPVVAAGCEPAWAHYTIRVPDGNRDKLAAALSTAGIANAIYYPRPLHRQAAYDDCPRAGGDGLAVTERLTGEVLSLPMHPYLDDDDQDRIADTVRQFLAGL